MNNKNSKTESDQADPKSWLSARVEPFWVNPATIKGTIALLFGLVVLLLPSATLFAFRLIVGGALVFSGASDLWFGRHSEGKGSKIWEGVLSVLVGLALVVVPNLAYGALVLIVSGYLLVRGVTSLVSAWSARGDRDWVPYLIRGALFVLMGIVLLVLPEGLLAGLMVGIATVSFILGGIMLGFGLQYRDEGDLVDIDAATVSQIITKWVDSRDIGDAKRERIGDTLFFESPDRTNKIVSWWVMLLLSVAIATFAVLQDSTAVVIGAMLIAPLMTPIIGTAAGIVYGWPKRVASSMAMVAGGVAGSIGLAFILATWVPALVPLGVNSQVVSRVSPTLVDMLIALAAGAAGAYATIDDRVSSSITGVAIAVALVPPLAVVGITLEAGQVGDSLGAFLLFLTNLVSIILAGGLVLLLTGFAPFKRFQAHREEVMPTLGLVALVGVLILVPLFFTAEGILVTSTRQSDAQKIVENWLEESEIRLVTLTVEGDQVDLFLTGSGAVPDIAALEDDILEKFGGQTVVLIEHAPTIILKDSDETNLEPPDTTDG